MQISFLWAECEITTKLFNLQTGKNYSFFSRNALPWIKQKQNKYYGKIVLGISEHEIKFLSSSLKKNLITDIFGLQKAITSSSGILIKVDLIPSSATVRIQCNSIQGIFRIK